MDVGVSVAGCRPWPSRGIALRHGRGAGRCVPLVSGGHSLHSATSRGPCRQVSAAKAAGDSNNDWVLTWRLLRDAGKEVPIEVVTDTFEEYYETDGEGYGHTATACKHQLASVARKRIRLPS